MLVGLELRISGLHVFRLIDTQSFDSTRKRVDLTRVRLASTRMRVQNL
jgi:hypothetical protein